MKAASLQGWPRGLALANIARRLVVDPAIGESATVPVYLYRWECELLADELRLRALALETEALASFEASSDRAACEAAL